MTNSAPDSKPSKKPASQGAAAQGAPKPSAFDDCYRAPNEDDDGYDPYSDRRFQEPLFERDPWR